MRLNFVVHFLQRFKGFLRKKRNITAKGEKTQIPLGENRITTILFITEIDCLSEANIDFKSLKLF